MVRNIARIRTARIKNLLELLREALKNKNIPRRYFMAIRRDDHWNKYAGRGIVLAEHKIYTDRFSDLHDFINYLMTPQGKIVRQISHYKGLDWGYYRNTPHRISNEEFIGNIIKNKVRRSHPLYDQAVPEAVYRRVQTVLRGRKPPFSCKQTREGIATRTTYELDTKELDRKPRWR